MGEDGEWKLKLLAGSEDQNYYDKEAQHIYAYPPPRYTPKVFIREEYFTSSYVRPQDRWAEENNESKIPNWILNMLLLDGECIIQTQTEINSSDLRRHLEMWKARANFLHAKKREQEEVHTRNLSGKKRKHDEMEQQKDSELTLQKEKVVKLDKEKVDPEKELASVCDELQQLREKKAQPL